MPELPNHLERLAHDLRGPLSPLQTAAYLLRRDDLDDARRRELADIVQRQTTRLSGMIDEVGDWIRAGEERLVRRREPTDLGLLLDLVSTSGGASPAGAPVIGWQLEPGLDQATVDGDPQRLAQMLGIVIAYARSRVGEGDGSIRLSGRRAGDGVRLCIADPSPAPPSDELELLFEMPQTPPYDDGLGLRLLIAQAIARAHDGRLHARRGNDGGTEYCAELPLLRDDST